MRPKISYVVTVYNKAKYLPHTIQSIRSQSLDCTKEFIFVDDASTDNSLEILSEETKNMKNVIIIKNEFNKGPSIRLNQGVKIASGEYLHLMDGDEILTSYASQMMLDLLVENEADFIYGKKKKTNLETHELLQIDSNSRPDYKLYSDPLTQILCGKFTGISLMSSKALYDSAGGCNERVFIQDESLPIRLAHKASRFIDLANTVVYAAKKGESNLSCLINQQHHDRFLAYKYAIEDCGNFIPSHLKQQMYQRAVSSIWKNKKYRAQLSDKIIFFVRYLYTRYTSPNPDLEELEKLYHHFDSYKDIRRILP